MLAIKERANEEQPSKRIKKEVGRWGMAFSTCNEGGRI